MFRAMHKLVSPLSLAGYLLATLAGSLHLHDHSHVHFDISSTRPAAVDPACHSHGHSHCCAHSHSHSHADETPAESSGHHHHHHGGLPQHDDDCVVCQYHAVKAVTAPTVAVAEFYQIVRTAEPLPVLRPESPQLSRPLSRGPPADLIN